MWLWTKFHDDMMLNILSISFRFSVVNTALFLPKSWYFFWRASLDFRGGLSSLNIHDLRRLKFPCGFQVLYIQVGGIACTYLGVREATLSFCLSQPYTN